MTAAKYMQLDTLATAEMYYPKVVTRKKCYHGKTILTMFLPLCSCWSRYNSHRYPSLLRQQYRAMVTSWLHNPCWVVV